MAEYNIDVSKSGDSNYTYWDVKQSDATYLGAFRLPSGTYGSHPGDTFSYNDAPTIALNGTDKMYVRGGFGSGHYAGIAEVNIPSTLSTSLNAGDLPVATISQNFYWPYPDLWEDDSFDDAHNGIILPGMCVVERKDGGGNVTDRKLVGTLYGAYASSTTMAPIWVLDGTALNGNNIRGMYTSPGVDGSHFAGWISHIPEEFQANFGADYLIGMSQGNWRSLNARGSNGPSLFTYNFAASDSITSNNPPSNGSVLDITAWADYPVGSFSLDPNQNNNPPNPDEVWTNCSEAYYGFVVPNTFTYLVIGYSGGHRHGVSYGPGYHATVDTDWDSWYWAFDIREIWSASSPTDPFPYEYGIFPNKYRGSGSYPYEGDIRGGSYDPVNKILYMTAHDSEPKYLRNLGSEYSIVLAYDMSGV